MKMTCLVGAALAALVVSLPAEARIHHRGYYYGPYHGYYGVPFTSPFFRNGLYGERDPFIRGQIERDIPLRDTPP